MLNILLIPVGILNLVRLKLMTRSPEKFMYQLSIVTTVKNEAPYLREWLRYHISVGVQHFYLYDNDSQDNLDEVLKDFSDYVTLTKIHGRVRQFDAYNDAINRFRYETKYMAVIDADEFIFRPGKDKLLLPFIDYLPTTLYIERTITLGKTGWLKLSAIREKSFTFQLAMLQITCQVFMQLMRIRKKLIGQQRKFLVSVRLELITIIQNHKRSFYESELEALGMLLALET